MEERAHALLSASSAKKWINCPPSARLEEQFEEQSSTFADEGSLAHEICELKLRKTFLEPMGDKTYKTALNKFKKHELYNPEMERYTEDYLDYVKTIAMSYDTTPTIAVEKKVDYSHVAPEGFGTADCIILHGNEIHVVDFKYGKGVPVNASGNPQMALYAAGAVAAYSIFYPIEKVYFHIVQPRINNFSKWETTVSELQKWCDVIVKPAAELAYKGEGKFKQGEWCDGCFCNASGCCRARADENMSLMEYANPETGNLPESPLLTNDEIGAILSKAQYLAKWVKKLEAYALSELLKGNLVPGWKAVAGRSNRVITDADAAYKELIKAGYKKAVLYNQVPVTLTEAEKLISKEDYNDILAKYIERPAGKPTLAPETDKREAIQLRPTAEDAFGGDNAYKEEA